MNTQRKFLAFFRLLLTCFAVGLISSAARAQLASENTNHPTRSAAVNRKNAFDLQDAGGDVDGRHKLILQELKSLAGRNDHPALHWWREWAGIYVCDGLGMNIRIAVAPKSGISYTYHGCMGLYDGNYGDVEGTFDDDGDGIPDGLKIKWALDVGNNFDFCSKKCYFVRWAGASGSPGRFYLVPESQMIEVVKDYNMGGYFREGLFGTPRTYDEHESERNPDTRPRVEGVPQLPPRWASQLLTGDWVARFIAISPATIGSADVGVYATEARVTLDKGRADGIYLGMEIPVGLKKPDAGRVTIDAVNQHTAEGVFRILTHDDEEAALPIVGQAIWILTSGDDLRGTNSP